MSDSFLENSQHYDDLLMDPVVRSFHRDHWFNVGWWDNCQTADQASHALLAQLISGVGRTPARCLDVGCGIGGSTRALQQQWRGATVIGLGRSERQLIHARRISPETGFVCANAVCLPFAAGSFDLVVAVESALHFNTRADFLTEARRVLAPGGQLALTDLIPSSKAWPGSWTVPDPNLGWSIAAYEARLADAGFQAAQVEDVTLRTWVPYLERFGEFVDALPVEQRIIWQPNIRALRDAGPPLYVMVSAQV